MTGTFNSFVPLIGLNEASSERVGSKLKQLFLKSSNTSAAESITLPTGRWAVRKAAFDEVTNCGL